MHGNRKNAIIRALSKIEIEGYKRDPESGFYVETPVNPTVITDSDNGAIAIVSAEDGHGFADYWGEYRGGYPWIHPELESFAKSRGLMWEWINPGCIGLYH